MQEPAAMLCIVLREHLQQKKNTRYIIKAQRSEWKQNILFGSYLNLRAVVQHENCSAHVVTSLFLYFCDVFLIVNACLLHLQGLVFCFKSGSA